MSQKNMISCSCSIGLAEESCISKGCGGMCCAAPSCCLHKSDYYNEHFVSSVVFAIKFYHQLKLGKKLITRTPTKASNIAHDT